jgi:hypothetical protein
MVNNSRNIERTIDKVEFARETWVTPDLWHPINVAPIKLKELKDEIASLPESEKKRRAAEFIEKNKIPESKLDVVPLVVTGTAAAVTTWTLVEVTKSGTLENMKLAVVWLWNRAGAFFEKQGGFMKDMWNEFRWWITSDLPIEKPKLFDSPIGWLKYTFFGFLKPSESDVSNNQVSSETVDPKNSQSDKSKKEEIDLSEDTIDASRALLLNKTLKTYSYLSPLTSEKKKILFDVLQSKPFQNITLDDIQQGRVSKNILAGLSLPELQSVFIKRNSNTSQISADIFSKIQKNPSEKIVDIIIRTPSSSLVTNDILWDISTISPNEIPSHIRSKFASIFQMKDWKIEDPVLQDLIKNSWLSLASATLLLGTDYSFDPKTKPNIWNTEAQKFFEEKLTPFSGKVIQSIVSTLPTDIQLEIKQSLLNDAKSSDIFQLYLILHGECDIKKWDQSQQWLVFIKMWSIINDAAIKWKLQNIVVTWITDAATYNNMTPELKNFLAQLWMNVGKWVMKSSWAAIENVWYSTTNNIPTSEKIALAAVFGTLIFLWLRFRFLFSVIKWSAIAAILLAVAPTAYAALKPNESEIQKDFEKLAK